MELPPLVCEGWKIEVLGPDVLRFIKEDGEKIEFSFYFPEYVKVGRLTELILILERSLTKGYFSCCVGNTFFELSRAGDQWILEARGRVELQLSCSTREALCLALALFYVREEEPSGHELYEMFNYPGLLSLFRKVGKIHVEDVPVSYTLVWEGSQPYLLPERAVAGTELATIMSLSEALGRKTIKISEEEALELIFSIEGLSEVLEDNEALMEARKYLARILASTVQHSSTLEFGKDEIHVKNEYGTWEIDLEDGDLFLNDNHICVELVSSMNIISLPEVGTLKVDENTAKVLSSLMVALRPDEVEDPSIRRQIRRALED